MGKGEFDALAAVMRRRIERRVADLAVEQVEQPFFGYEFTPVEQQLQAAVEAGVIPQALLDVFEVEGVFAEDLLVGEKFDFGAVGLGAFAALLLFEVAAAEMRLGVFAVAA